MSNAEQTNYQTLSDFARLIGVHRTTVLAWVRSGKIKSKKKSNSKKGADWVKQCSMSTREKLLLNVSGSHTQNIATLGAKQKYMFCETGREQTNNLQRLLDESSTLLGLKGAG